MMIQFLVISALFVEIVCHANEVKGLVFRPPQSQSIEVSGPHHWHTDLNVRNGMMADQVALKGDEISRVSEIFGLTAGIMALSLFKEENALREKKSSADLLFEGGQTKKEQALRASAPRLPLLDK